jgi:6-phosphofructokinase 1
VNIAVSDGTGYMATIRRSSTAPYRSYYDKVPLDRVANSVRHLPDAWISSDQLDVTDDFVAYAQPLIGQAWPNVPVIGQLQRFARLNLNLIPKKLKPYVPTGHRR